MNSSKSCLHLLCAACTVHDDRAVACSQDGLEVGATATIEQLIQALQEDESAAAWQQAAKHLLRIAGESLTSGNM